MLGNKLGKNFFNNSCCNCHCYLSSSNPAQEVFLPSLWQGSGANEQGDVCTKYGRWTLAGYGRILVTDYEWLNDQEEDFLVLTILPAYYCGFALLDHICYSCFCPIKAAGPRKQTSSCFNGYKCSCYNSYYCCTKGKFALGDRFNLDSIQFHHNTIQSTWILSALKKIPNSGICITTQIVHVFCEFAVSVLLHRAMMLELHLLTIV